MLLIVVALIGLILFTFYQIVRQDDRLDKARGSVRFLLTLFLLCQIAVTVSLASAL